ncbi:DegT/DnrJ/EryC1/StrS family aminotransferase [Patescibacteria group bacterium]|nr:DegT/DnrJ/EryC1/StrS family aminotransferase [Patescibacteria group bacterium]MBU1967495.1 DegT/DnrJ/EryC1/StrS family aminotransferase [Patescibacteria group bacterium]
MDIQSILATIKKEEKRNENFLHLTANEAQMSETARMFLGSKLSERYYFGGGTNSKIDLGPFTALGYPGIEKLLHQAQEAAKKMLHAESVNLNCLSGVHAMMCSILSTTQAGDTIMTVKKDSGGHFATAGILERVGRKQVFAEFDLENLRFDTKKIAKIFQDSNATAFYMDVSYYINPHNLREIRQALGEKAIIIYDASHTMGLIMGGIFQSPLTEGADVISANTHKTLPGPQKGMIAFKDKNLGDKANAIINGCLHSSPHTHHLIALATTILEMKEFGQNYAQQVVQNSNDLAGSLANLGYEIRKSNTGRYSENHQVHLFTEKIGDYKDLYAKLFNNHLAVNFDQPLGRGKFIRLGTQEITRRGMKKKEMQQIAEFLDKSFKGENIKDGVMRFNKTFNKIYYSFDIIDNQDIHL